MKELTIKSDKIIDVESMCLTCYEKTQNGAKFPEVSNDTITPDEYEMKDVLYEDREDIKTIISTCKKCGNKVWIRMVIQE
jgi:hypothetical protein